MIRINLLPIRASRRQESIRREVVIGGALMFFLLGICVIAQGFVVLQVEAVKKENQATQVEIERLRAIVQEVDQAEKLKEDLNRKLRVIKELKANKAGPVRMLEELSSATPEKLQISSLVEKDGIVKLTGVAVSNEVISQFLSNLDRSEYYTDVFLNSIDQKVVDDVKLKQFALTARVIVPALEAIKQQQAKEAEEQAARERSKSKTKAKAQAKEQDKGEAP